MEFAPKNDIVVFPGARTPTDPIAAWKTGADFVKIFLCGPQGGPGYIRALKLPFPQVPLIATGGVDQRTAGDFILNGATVRENRPRAKGWRVTTMTKRLVMVFGLSVLGTIHPLPAAEGVYEIGPKQSFEVTNTERVPFAPGGTIRLHNSYGYLTVEGWDEPEVEIAVIKSTDSFHEPSQQERAEQPFAQVRVVTERRSDKELAISTILPGRNRFLPKAKRGVTVEYRIHVPRDSRLVVHHDNGYVWVSDMTGDLDVRSHTGDMIVMLPDPGLYSIDARTRMGSVSSDFTGKSLNRLSQFLVGTHFDYASQTPKRRIYLRMGRGSIEIKQDLPYGPVEKH